MNVPDAELTSLLSDGSTIIGEESDSDDPLTIEIWDDSDSDADEAEEKAHVSSIVQHVIKATTLFLTALQLFFKLPEKAMSSLLIFMRMLLI